MGTRLVFLITFIVIFIVVIDTAYTIGRIHGAKELSERIIEHFKKLKEERED